MTTTVHAYSYDISTPEGKTAWNTLQAYMAAQNVVRIFHALGSYYMPQLDGVVVTLETKHVFDNQWNTAPIPGVSDSGYRLFDWALEAVRNSAIKRGHWLEQTPEMIALRADTLKCGYCGTQYSASDPTTGQFCVSCLGSEYLKSTELYLTRIAGLAINTKRAPLTDEETAVLMPLYLAEQAGKGTARAIAARARMRASLDSDYETAMTKTVDTLTVKYRGKAWLMDHGCSMRLLKDVIYYDSRSIFTFGWQHPLDNDSDLDWLLANLSEFPYEYEIKTIHRGTLSGRE